MRHSAQDTRSSGGAVLGLLVALALAASLIAPTPAGAESASVTVTATIAPVFSLTILTDGAVTFGEVPAGAVYESSDTQVLRVRSNRPWELSDSSDTEIAVGDLVLPRETFVRHSVTPSFGVGQPAGVHDILCTYTLDLTAPEALDLPAGTLISTRFGYTAVQQ
ncbi:MAG: hypothetical protein ISP10_00035 [Aeromicrobium sp.]|nr:hypothetical protein [Aeromicrobium sp.]